MRIFIDTAPFIYLAESKGRSSDKVAIQISRWIEDDYAIFSSVITLAEILVHPKKKQDISLVREYKELLMDILSSPLLEINSETAELTSQYRAKYNLSAPDAFQLACAKISKCNVFYTNDKKMRRIKDIEVILV